MVRCGGADEEGVAGERLKGAAVGPGTVTYEAVKTTTTTTRTPMTRTPMTRTMRERETKPLDSRMVPFDPVSLPGFNSILESMKVPLAKPDKCKIRQALQNAALLHLQFPFFLGFSAITEARKMGIPVVCSFHVQPENLLLNVGLRSRLLSRLLYKFFVAGFYNRADLVIATCKQENVLLNRSTPAVQLMPFDQTHLAGVTIEIVFDRYEQGMQENLLVPQGGRHERALPAGRGGGGAPVDGIQRPHRKNRSDSLTIVP